MCDGARRPDERRALHRDATPAAPVLAEPRSAAGWARCARCSPTPAARTPRPASAGSTTPPRRRAPPRSRSASIRREVALASTGGISQRLPVDSDAQGDPAGASRCCSHDGDADFQRAIQTTDAVREAREPRGRAALGDGPPERPVQGRGDDLAALRDDALLHRDRRRARRPRRPTCCSASCVKRSFDRASVDGQLSTNDTAILMCSGASGVQRRARERGRAALRRGARRAAAPARDHDGRRRRGRRADRARASCAAATPTRRRGGRPRGRQLAAREGRAARRRPQLGADRPGGRRRAARGTAPLAVDIAIEGIAGLLGRRRDRPTTSARSPRPSQGDGGRVRDRPARARAPRPSVFFSDLSARVRHDQRRVHDMSRAP